MTFSDDGPFGREPWEREVDALKARLAKWRNHFPGVKEEWLSSAPAQPAAPTLDMPWEDRVLGATPYGQPTNFGGQPAAPGPSADNRDALLACARSWEPEVRLLGNVRARTIAKICVDAESAEAQLAAVRNAVLVSGISEQRADAEYNLATVTEQRDAYRVSLEEQHRTVDSAERELAETRKALEECSGRLTHAEGMSRVRLGALESARAELARSEAYRVQAEARVKELEAENERAMKLCESLQRGFARG